MTHRLAIRSALPVTGVSPRLDASVATVAAPFDRPAITARVSLAAEDGTVTDRDVPGRAHAWTRTAVYVELHLSAGDTRHAWLPAADVSRRAIPG